MRLQSLVLQCRKITIITVSNVFLYSPMCGVHMVAILRPTDHTRTNICTGYVVYCHKRKESVATVHTLVLIPCFDH